MPESPLAVCLRLCRRARALDGGALAATLTQLEAELAQLLAAPPRAPEAKLSYVRVLEQINAPILTMDLAGYLTGWNKGAERLFGYTADEVIGQHVLFLYADDDQSVEIDESVLDWSAAPREVRRRKKSGEVFWVSHSLSLIRDDGDEPVGIVAHLAEITERLTAAEKQRLHSRIIQDSDQGIMITDAEQRIVSVNAAFTRITGYSPAEALGQTPDLLRSGVHDDRFRDTVRDALHGAAPWQGEIVGRRKNGELFPQSVSIAVVRDEQGDITHAFSIFSDISVHKDAEARIQRLANYDAVTGLPNHVLLDQLLGQALTTAKRTNDYGALLVIDLNRFAAINDALGQEIGNALLCEIGARFRQTLRDEDVLARIGPSEFAVALLNIQKREHAGTVAHKLLAALDVPVVIDATELHIGASVGVSVFPEDGMDTASLSRSANIAMARVQQSGEPGYMFYRQEMNERAKAHLRIESELRHALTGNELLLYYQPKVSLRSGHIVGAEALIRWRHPQQGMVAPGTFIPVAEESGLILNIGTWVLEESCRQIRQWQDDGLNMPPVAVNLSARQFDHHLPARIQAVLDCHGIAPDRLKLEITESLLVRGAENVIAIMNELAAMGLALALDDFGTGYSSLAYLKKFPISTLKIDRSFVIGLPHEENDSAIARAIVTMAQQLRQEIVAEGVETIEQMTFLRDLGCDQLQGYLFSPPVAAGEFARMVSEGKRLVLD